MYIVELNSNKAQTTIVAKQSCFRGVSDEAQATAKSFDNVAPCPQDLQGGAERAH